VTNILGISILVGLLSSFGMYKQIQANGEIKNELETKDKIIASQILERAKLEETLLENSNKKRVIYRDKEKIKYLIKEVQTNASPEDCINQPVPVELNCLFRVDGCQGVPGGPGSADSADPGP